MAGHTQRCVCKTTKGDQCKKDAVEGSKFCYIHKKRCVSEAKAKAKSKKVAKVEKRPTFDPELLVKKVISYSKRNPDSSLDDLFAFAKKEFGGVVDNINVKREIAKIAKAALIEQGYILKRKAAKASKAPKAKAKAKAKKAAASEPKQKLLKIVEKLRAMETKSRAEKEIYFSGEYDPKQTEFERRSNLMEVGVLTKGGPKVGFAALHILRYIIDRSYPSHFIDDIEAAEDDKKTLLKFMQDEESRYGTHFPESGIFRARIEDEIIERSINDVEVWTLDDIEKRIKRFK